VTYNFLNLEGEYNFLSGTMTWVSAISVVFFVIWVAGTGIGITASVFYATQAAIVFCLILGLLLFFGFRSYKLNVWYDEEFEAARSKIATDRGVKPQQIPNDEVEKSGVAENPFQSFIGPHGKNFGKLFAAIAGPIVGYLSITVPVIQKVMKVFKDMT